MKKINIPGSKKYQFPHVVKIPYAGLLLVIADETANWIICENKNQELFFDLLSEYQLDEALNLYHGDIKDAQYILIQLDATDFECKQTHSLEPPMALHLYVTNQCNLRCPRCYMSAGNKKEQSYISTNDYKTILKEFAKRGGFHVTFSGGEPTLRTDIIELIQYAKKECELQTELYTNGINWALQDPQFYKSIKDILDNIQISIDGYSEKKNAELRGVGIFEQTLSSVNAFLEAGIKTTIAVTPMFEDSKEVESYIQFGKSCLERFAAFDNFRIIFSGRLLDGRDKKYDIAFKQRYNDLVNKVNIGVFGEDSDTDMNKFRHKHYIKNNCAYGNITISASGDVYFCSRTPEMKPYGNIYNMEWKDALNVSKKVQRLSRVENLLPCRYCELRNICGGDCRIEFFDEFKDCASIVNNHNNPERHCDQSIKDSFFSLMVKSQKRLFKLIE